MAAALLSPVVELDMQALPEALARYGEAARAVAEGAGEEADRLNRTIIERECAAYILDKADALGISAADAAVTARWSEEGFWPGELSRGRPGGALGGDRGGARHPAGAPELGGGHMSRALETLGKYKYLLLVLLLGLILLLWPTGGGGGAAPDEGRTEAEARLEAVLGEVSGAGRVSVLYSDEGVAVVCEGAESARVRLDIVNAVSAYTGFGSDRIKVLSMERSD